MLKMHILKNKRKKHTLQMEDIMDFHKIKSEFYCGVDLHSTFLYATVVDVHGNAFLRRKIKNDFDAFCRHVQPFLPNLAVGTESTYNWYWLADGCKQKNIPFYLGHALNMKLITSAKKKNDKLDSQTQADLMRNDFFPKAYAYPLEMRAGRDLLRRRNYFVVSRAAANSHIQTIFDQQGILDISGRDVKTKTTRRSLLDILANPDIKLSVSSDLDVMDILDAVIRKQEKHIRQQAKHHNPKALEILQTVPGIGDILSLTILYEIHTISRFSSVKKFSSYSRVVKCERSSAGKRTGGGNQKIGNPYLKWTFDQIINKAQQQSEGIKKKYNRLVSKHGTRKARAIMGHKFAVAVYYMLKNNEPFDEDKFLQTNRNKQ